MLLKSASRQDHGKWNLLKEEIPGTVIGIHLETLLLTTTSYSTRYSLRKGIHADGSLPCLWQLKRRVVYFYRNSTGDRLTFC